MVYSSRPHRSYFVGVGVTGLPTLALVVSRCTGRPSSKPPPAFPTVVVVVFSSLSTCTPTLMFSAREKVEVGRLPVPPPCAEMEERAKEWGEEGRP